MQSPLRVYVSNDTACEVCEAATERPQLSLTRSGVTFRVYTTSETKVCYEGYLYYFLFSALGKYDDCKPHPREDAYGDSMHFTALPGMCVLPSPISLSTHTFILQRTSRTSCKWVLQRLAGSEFREVSIS
jgi:hypothetical protein